MQQSADRLPRRPGRRPTPDRRHRRPVRLVLEYPTELADYSAQTQAELGLTGNGDDDTLGNLDEARIDGILTQIRDAGLDVPEDLTADQLFTNEFIDESIGVTSGEEPAGTERRPPPTHRPAPTGRRRRPRQRLGGGRRVHGAVRIFGTRTTVA